MATSVESNKPRAFRSLIKAAIARSTRRALGRWSCMLPWASQLLFEPGVDQLDHSYALLDQPAGDQALISERCGVAGGELRKTGSVAFGLAPGVEHLGRLAHHAPRPHRKWRSWREGRDCPDGWRYDARSGRAASSARAPRVRATVPGDAGRVSVAAPERCALPGGSAAGNCCPTPGCRHKACARKGPRTTATQRIARAEPIAQPGAQGGQRHRGRAGVHRQHRLEMLDDVGVQAADHAQIVGQSGKVRKELADPEARRAALAKPERRAQQRALARLIAPQPERRNRLAMPLG